MDYAMNPSRMLLLIALGSITAVAQEAPEMSVCDALVDVVKLDRKDIAVRGQFRDGFE